MIAAESVARGTPGTISVEHAGAFRGTQQKRQSGKIRERIAENAQPDIAAVAGCEPFDESRDLLAAAAYEQRGVVHHPADESDAVAF